MSPSGLFMLTLIVLALCALNVRLWLIVPRRHRNRDSTED
jgi:hypothetical protein